jgi:hypothetical protein
MPVASFGSIPACLLSALVLGSALLAAGPAPQTRPASQPEATAEALLDRWARAVGGVDRLRRIENVYVKSAHTGTGGAGDVEEWMTRAGQRRQVSRLALDPVVVTYDGTTAWQLRASRARKLPAEEAAGQRGAALTGTLAHLVPGQPGVRVELLGDDPSGRCHALRVQVGGGGTGTIVHLDKATALPARTLVQFPSGPFTFENLEWREFDGVKLPSRIRITSAGGYRAEETLQEVRWNDAFDAALFSRPADGPKTFRFTGGESASLPFQTDGWGHIFLQGQVEGSKPVWLTIDTGASGSLLDADFARSLGLELAGEGAVTGPAGPVQTSFVRGARVKLPGVELTLESASAMPLEFLSRGCGRRIVAILGYEFFERFVVEIDHAARTLRLRDPDGFTYSGKGESIPITLHAQQPYIRAQVEIGQGKRLEGEFVVDLGSGATLMLASDFDARHGILAAAESPLRESAGGAGGAFELSVARVAALRVGTFTLQSPVVLFPKGEITAPGKAGNIGAGLLRRFRVILDYARERILLEPTDRIAEPDEHDMSGLRFAGDGPDFTTLRVKRVSAGSPAAEAGVQREDILERVNGRAVSELGLSGVRDLLKRHGAELELVVRRGTTERNVKLVLRRRI